MIKKLKLWWCEWHYWRAMASAGGLYQYINDGVPDDEIDFVEEEIKWYEAVAADYKIKIKELKGA